jgi:hypothetical protein
MTEHVRRVRRAHRKERSESEQPETEGLDAAPGPRGDRRQQTDRGLQRGTEYWQSGWEWIAAQSVSVASGARSAAPAAAASSPPHDRLVHILAQLLDDDGLWRRPSSVGYPRSHPGHLGDSDRETGDPRPVPLLGCQDAGSPRHRNASRPPKGAIRTIARDGRPLYRVSGIRRLAAGNVLTRAARHIQPERPSKNAAMSRATSSGSSAGAKWPPVGITVHRLTS